VKNPATPVLIGLPVVSSTNHGIARRTIRLPVTEIAFATRTAERGLRLRFPALELPRSPNRFIRAA
jgi:hypothetical protein